MAHRRLGADMDSENTTPRQLTVRISRGAGDGEFTVYSVPWRDNQTVLDVVTEVQRTLEPSLSYRYACRVGVCGSCAMTVNGKPRWTCRTHVSRVEEDGVIVIEPLRNMPRIKDLVVDMREFFQNGSAPATPSWARRRVMIRRRWCRRRARSAAGRRRHRMHQLRRVLRGLRRGVLGPGVSRPGGAEPRLDAVQRRAPRRSQGRAATGDLGQRLQFLPHAGQLHEALSG